MRRRMARPYGQSMGMSRFFSLAIGLAILWMIYDRMRDPNVWRWMSAQEEVVVQVEAPSPEALQPDEVVVEGKNDRDPEEKTAGEQSFERVIDRAPLLPREMPVYWRLMQWSRAEPLPELEKRARGEIPFQQVFEQPERYRGQLVRMRMRVRRVLEFNAPKNDADVKTVYEAYAWTDQSLSLPYIVVMPDLPVGLPLGAEVRADMIFTGYVMKVMRYTAGDGNSRGAPLLIGRGRVVARVVEAPKQSWDATNLLLGGGIVALLLVGVVMGAFRWKKPRGQRGPVLHENLPDQIELSTGGPASEHGDRIELPAPKPAGNPFPMINLETAGTRADEDR